MQAVTEKPDVMSIAGRVETMLNHYFRERMTREDWDIILDDWIDLLGGIPFWAVEYACRRWMREDRRKPTPHYIWKMASDEVLRLRKELDNRHEAITQEPEPVEITPEERERRAKFAADILKAKGFTGKPVSNAPTFTHWADGLTIEEENDRLREARKAYANPTEPTISKRVG